MGSPAGSPAMIPLSFCLRVAIPGCAIPAGVVPSQVFAALPGVTLAGERVAESYRHMSNT